MNNVITCISGFKSFVFDEIFFNHTLMVMSYLTLIIVMSFVKRPSPQKFYWILTCIVCIQLVFIYENITNGHSEELIVFHQYEKTVIANRKGHNLNVYSKGDSLDKNTSKMIRAYQQNYYNLNVNYRYEIRNIFNFNGSSVLLLDNETWPYDINFKPDIIILSNSPKINLDRFLNLIEPKIVIADATNYGSYVTIWRSSCSLKGYRFYETSKSGAFVKRYGT